MSNNGILYIKNNNKKKNTNFIIIYKLWGNPSYLFIYLFLVIIIFIKNLNLFKIYYKGLKYNNKINF